MSNSLSTAAPKPPLLRDLTVVIVLKIAVVIAAALFVFSPAQRPKIDAARVESRLIGPPSDQLPSRTAAP